MKFTKEQKEDIKQIKSHISNLQKLQETSYDLMINRLGIENGDALWDYCFNNFGSLKQIEKAAKPLLKRENQIY